MRRRTFFAVMASALGAFALLKDRASEQPRAAAPRAHYFPNVELLTHENRKVRFYDDLVRGKIVAINFMYTQCTDGICPLMTANLVKVHRALYDRVGRDVFMYSLTLTPEADTPEILNAYAKGFGVKPGWRFLTGSPEDIELLRRRLGFVDPDPIVDQDKDSHAGVVLFGNEALDRWAAVPALSRPQWIAEKVLWMDPRSKYRTVDGRTRIITA